MINRPDFIKNLNDIPEEAHYLDQPSENYRSRKRIGKATATETFGINYSRLKPGQVSSKFHYHSEEEEFLLILKGKAVLRYDNTQYEVVEGDAISLRPNKKAHQLTNPYKEDCLYLEFGTRKENDIITYPDDGHIRKKGEIKKLY